MHTFLLSLAPQYFEYEFTGVLFLTVTEIFISFEILEKIYFGTINS